MVDSTSSGLLEELNAKHRRPRYWIIAAVAAFVANLVAWAASAPTWIIIALPIISIPGVLWIAWRDELAKCVVLFYDLEQEFEDAYCSVCKEIDELASCARVWHVDSAAQVHDRKYHAGASSLVSRNRISISTGQPPYVRTNIAIPSIPVGRQRLFFFPDRLLVYASNGVGAIAYSDLNLGISSTNFVEEEGVPSDSKIVGQTWRYVNKSGGPDRRFNNNHQIPVCQYAQLWLKSPLGLNELIQVSKMGVIEGLIQSILKLSSVLKPPEANKEPQGLLS
ncbi:MAG: hypothetical protein PHI18_01570 [bacterium]|nr:hypothetical protein [bacterium]